MSPPPAFTAPTSLLTTSFHGTNLPSTCATTTAIPISPPRISMAFSSIDRILTPDPVSVPGPPSDVVAAVYNQVLGNAYLMESERDELANAESQFRRTGHVRFFVRSIALSETYKSRFFYPVSQYRFIELAFKHLLARAPTSREEYAKAMRCYHEDGYDAVVYMLTECDEYTEYFGDYIVPYGVYKGCYPRNEVFNRSVAMRLTPSSSDKGRSAMLQYAVCADVSPSWLSVAKGLPPGTERGTGFTIGGHWTSTQRNRNAPVRVGTKIPGGVVFY